jgi:hypothetical protein
MKEKEFIVQVKCTIGLKVKVEDLPDVTEAMAKNKAEQLVEQAINTLPKDTTEYAEHGPAVIKREVRKLTKEKKAKYRIGASYICESESCAFNRECANHATAGQFREEGGFSPELHEENGEFFCFTQGEEVDPEVSRIGAFPANSDRLGQGFLSYKDGKWKTYDPMGDMDYCQ